MHPLFVYTGFTIRGRRIYIEKVPGEPAIDMTNILTLQQFFKDCRCVIGDPETTDGEDLIPAKDHSFSLGTELRR